mmetsp:Transcript_27537/g.63856  ORF Transcript_27537/g.63856 Transcript_27537/m.63856 type:complete len:242 (+) Transcript_27537:1177-1902(+)
MMNQSMGRGHGHTIPLHGMKGFGDFQCRRTESMSIFVMSRLGENHSDRRGPKGREGRDAMFGRYLDGVTLYMIKHIIIFHMMDLTNDGQYTQQLNRPESVGIVEYDTIPYIGIEGRPGRSDGFGIGGGLARDAQDGPGTTPSSSIGGGTEDRQDLETHVTGFVDSSLRTEGSYVYTVDIEFVVKGMRILNDFINHVFATDVIMTDEGHACHRYGQLQCNGIRRGGWIPHGIVVVVALLTME